MLQVNLMKSSSNSNSDLMKSSSNSNSDLHANLTLGSTK